MPDFANVIVEALTYFKDGVFNNLGLSAFVATVVAARFRPVLRKVLPPWVDQYFGDVLEQAVKKAADEGVRAAEEYGARAAKAGIVKVENGINKIKFDYAKAYIQRVVPNFVASDEEVGRYIDAALHRAGLGASSFIKKVADRVVAELPVGPEDSK